MRRRADRHADARGIMAAKRGRVGDLEIAYDEVGRGARSAVVPDAGHQPQLENPEAWLAAIREHLPRVRGAA